jgi:hypothetical protein
MKHIIPERNNFPQTQCVECKFMALYVMLIEKNKTINKYYIKCNRIDACRNQGMQLKKDNLSIMHFSISLFWYEPNDLTHKSTKHDEQTKVKFDITVKRDVEFIGNP